MTDEAGLGVPAGATFIDCDSHWTEPADLWVSRVPAAVRDQVPQLGRPYGADVWMLNGEVWATTGSNTIGQGRSKVVGEHVMSDFADIDPCAWSVPSRLALLDDIGCAAQVIYPNGVGFASNHMFAIEDIEQRKRVLSVYNDFFVDLQEESRGRLLPQALLPVWDMDFTVSEMTRLIDKGIRGFTLSDKPELIGLPELWDDYFTPMWDIFNESGAVASFHIGSGATKAEKDASRGLRTSTAEPDVAPAAREPNAKLGELAGYTAVSPAWGEFGAQRGLVVRATQAYMSNVRIVVNLCMSSLFDRFPKLKVVSAESGIGWVPFILESLEYQLDEMVTNADEVGYAKRRPAEYFREHMYVMFWFEQSGPEKLISAIGAGNILLETDIPHSTCLYPGPREHFEKVLANVPTSDCRRVLSGNAAELYKITL